MSNRDAVETYKLIHGEQPQSKYGRKLWVEIPDRNASNLARKEIRFDTIENQSELLVWSQAYMTFYIKLTDTNASDLNRWDADTEIALKAGIASVVDSLQIIVNNTTVQNSSSLPIPNYIRKLLKASSEYERINDEGFYIDRNLGNDPVITLSNAHNTGTSLTDSGVNNGYDRRVSEFRRNSDLTINAGVSTEVLYKVRLPLRDVSNFFENLDYPISGLRVQIKMTLNTDCYSVYDGDIARNSKGVMTLEDQPERPLLFVPEVQYLAEDWDDLRSQMKSTKDISFMDCRVFDYDDIGGEGSTIDRLISSNIRNAHSIVALLSDRTSPVAGGGAVARKSNPNDVEYVFRGKINNLQVLIDNKNYLESPINSDSEQYDYFKDALLNDASYEQEAPVISRNEFVENHRIHIIRLDRDASRASFTGKPQSIQLRGNVGEAATLNNYLEKSIADLATANLDLKVIVFYKQKGTLNLGTGDVLIE